jgi:CheY-like chemotaxis protein
MIKILVVEDEPMSSEPVVEYLRMKGMEVFLVKNGKEALHLLEKETIDWVLTDIVMPDMDGFELLRDLRLRFPSLRCIAWSGAVNKELYLKVASHICASHVLQKPIVLSEILSIINEQK